MIDWKPVGEWTPEADTVLAWITNHDDGQHPKAVFAVREAEGNYRIAGYQGAYTITHFAEINGPDGSPAQFEEREMPEAF